MRYTMVVVLVLTTCCARTERPAPVGAEPPAPAYFYASQAGKPTIDRGEGGGNPFASAFVELLAQATLEFEDFSAQLVELTRRKSGGLQEPDVGGPPPLADWQFLPRPPGERRVALVLVFSDYSAAEVSSLPGAAHDLVRVVKALEQAEFSVTATMDPSRSVLSAVLREFAARSEHAEVAVLYTTGHGVEVGGTVLLLPSDEPFARGETALMEQAVHLTDLGTALRASRANLVFYGGCRTGVVW